MSKKDILEISNIDYLARVYKDYKNNLQSVSQELEDFFTKNQKELDNHISLNDLEDAKNTETKDVLSANFNLGVFYKNIAKTIIENHIKYAQHTHQSSYVFKEEKNNIDELSHSFYGLDEKTLEKEVNLKGYYGFNAISFKNLFKTLQSLFCKDVNYSIYHLSEEEKDFFVKNIKAGNSTKLDESEKLEVFKDLVKSQHFESFLATKFVGVKRFGADGVDSFMVFLQALTKHANKNGVKDILTGMAHRGRLNCLYNFSKKPLQDIFAEFSGNVEINDDTKTKSFDVKYHMGYKGVNNGVSVEILPNPSHLEAINPVVLGKLKALQDERKEAKSSCALLVHGDSAYYTLGVNQETFTLNGLQGYDTKGTLHLILNNDLGFTAQAGIDYPQDHNAWGYFLKCPVLHVHADKIEELYKLANLALDYKIKFNKDIFINIIGYRKFGHNEGDEPNFTNPLYYKNTKNFNLYVQNYKESLVKQGFDENKLDDFIKDNQAFMEEKLKQAQETKTSPLQFNNAWQGFDIKKHDAMQENNTTCKQEDLTKLLQNLNKIPENFALNNKIKRQITNRAELAKANKIDWATAESLAYASLLQQGFNVRLSGEDAKRGTFSHRHAVYIDQENGKEYNVLQNLPSSKGDFNVYNSTISEFGVLGFDYGYSLQNPNNLTIWEAQFGDFANGGQVIIDQFISSAESKWFMLSNLVMLLPHGLEGQGPEHSSARLERFLQLCANNNMLVAYPTTPANLFHLLRAQVLASYKKPLVVMSPKSLLRHKDVVSDLSDFTLKGFEKIIVDSDNKKVKKVVLCTGKVYYDLKKEKEERNTQDILIIRLESLHPFPYNELEDALKNVDFNDILWVQEEHENSGAYYYVKDKINEILLNLNKTNNILYAGRKPSPSPACGFMLLHNEQKQDFLTKVFDL